MTLNPGPSGAVAITGRGGALQWRYSHTQLVVNGDLVMYGSSNPDDPDTPLSLSSVFQSGLWNSSLLVAGTMIIGHGAAWNMWVAAPASALAEHWTAQNKLTVHKLQITDGGQLFFGCDEILGCAVGSSSTHLIVATNDALETSGGSIVVALPSADHSVQFLSSVTVSLSSQNGGGYSGVLKVASGAVTVIGKLKVVGTGTATESDPPTNVSASIVVYETTDTHAPARALASLNVTDTLAVRAGSMFRVIGMTVIESATGVMNPTTTTTTTTTATGASSPPIPIVTAPILSVDSDSTLQLDLNPSQPVAIPGAGMIVVDRRTSRSGERAGVRVPLIPWDRNISPTPLIVQLFGFTPSDDVGGGGDGTGIGIGIGIGVTAAVTDRGLALVFDTSDLPETVSALWQWWTRFWEAIRSVRSGGRFLEWLGAVHSKHPIASIIVSAVTVGIVCGAIGLRVTRRS